MNQAYIETMGDQVVVLTLAFHDGSSMQASLSLEDSDRIVRDLQVRGIEFAQLPFRFEG